MADVFSLVRDASTDEDLRRALKWLLVLHDVLLRLPPRGGRRGRGVLARRFAAWCDGDLSTLVRWWLHDRAAAHRRQQHESRDAQRITVDARRALRLMAEGDISRGLKLLTSIGLGDLTDERITEQLAAKHPHRKEDLPATLEGYAPFARVNVAVGETLRQLDPRSGTGASGSRNSYLR
eukprot:498983-Karenia_brevis.AAC.1